jgi:hypothetical protein
VIFRDEIELSSCVTFLSSFDEVWRENLLCYVHKQWRDVVYAPDSSTSDVMANFSDKMSRVGEKVRFVNVISFSFSISIFLVLLTLATLVGVLSTFHQKDNYKAHVTAISSMYESNGQWCVKRSEECNYSPSWRKDTKIDFSGSKQVATRMIRFGLVVTQVENSMAVNWTIPTMKHGFILQWTQRIIRHTWMPSLSQQQLWNSSLSLSMLVYSCLCQEEGTFNK